MSQQLEQHIGQRLVQRLTPQQVRFVRLLEMTRQEAEDTVDRELEANPALESVDNPVDEGLASRFDAANGDIPSYRLRAVNRRHDDDTPTARDIALMIASESESLYDHLRSQLDEREMTPEVHQAADYIVGNLDTSGYLRRSPEAMVDDMAFTSGVIIDPDDMRKALAIVRGLDPVGVGASGLQDALAMQLEAMPQSAVRDNALAIIRRAFEALIMHHPHRIISILKLKKDAYDEAIRLIRSLNPRPGASFGSGDADKPGVAVPDFAVEEDESGELHISIPTHVPELAIDESFAMAVADMERNAVSRKQKGKNGKDEDSAYVFQLYRDARDFIEIWKQRQTTLMSVMTAIVKLQRRYFLTSDDSDLRPMALRDIAELTGYDLSTVSRATAGKYVATSWGIISLRHLFSERMGSGEASGESASGGSARSIQAALKALVEAEDKLHPLSDEELTARLVEAGHAVKRRTVAKYRELLNIPPSRLRRKL